MVIELFQNLNKYVFDDKMLILFQPRGDVANLIVVGEKYETYFGKLFTHKITDDEFENQIKLFLLSLMEQEIN